MIYCTIVECDQSTSSICCSTTGNIADVSAYAKNMKYDGTLANSGIKVRDDSVGVQRTVTDAIARTVYITTRWTVNTLVCYVVTSSAIEAVITTGSGGAVNITVINGSLSREWYVNGIYGVQDAIYGKSI